MQDTGELMWTSDVTRRHQRDKTPCWCRREHATTGVDQFPGPRPVTLSSEGRPLAVSGSLWGPARCVVACSLDSVWSSAIAGAQGTGACSRLSPPVPGPRSEAGVTPAVHLRGTGSVSSAILTIRKVPKWHVGVVPGATEFAVRAVLVLSGSLGAAMQRQPRKYSAVTGALVAGRAVT